MIFCEVIFSFNISFKRFMSFLQSMSISLKGQYHEKIAAMDACCLDSL